MSITIPALTRRAVPVVLAAAFAVNPAVTAAGPANASDGKLVPMRSIMRACDFTPISRIAAENNAAVSAVIRVTGGTVAADVHISETGTPNTHFDVVLIQMPRASTSPCTAPGPGVAVAGADTDGVGEASTTVQDGIRSGTTGVWVLVQRPSPYSQSPLEFYTSDYISPV